tara:strand:- start:193078 stop:196218 length:3141 start_codon:yes stop_codon:yes gene_type:complete
MSSLPPNTEMKGLIAWFGHNHVAANILMILFIVGGLFSIANMRTETFPSIDPKLITISVIYPGASPYEVAESITDRVEETLVGIDGVKRISASASEGYGLIMVELEDFANGDDVYNDVDTAVNSISDFPPEQAERPIISKAKPTPNVMTLAIHGDAAEATIKFWAENLEDELRLLPGVSQTNLRGIRNYEISIEISENTLRKYDLSLSEVRDAVDQFSVNVPAGTVESKQGDILLRVQEQRYTGVEFEKIVIRALPDGSTLRLSDIATVVDGFEDIDLVSRFNSERAAFIDVSRSETDDTITVANEINAYLNKASFPKGVNVTLQQDETVNLRDRINLMMRNAIIGFALVFLVLLLFLDFKLAFWTSVAIPVSFLGGLMIINFLGYSLNMISLFALIVVLGIVVDDAIVTGESIFDEQEKNKDDPNAFLKGLKKVIAPVTIGVSTTIAAFAPLLFSTGVMGQIIAVIPIVVIPILVVSLAEAFLILPAHLSKTSRWSVGIVADIRNRFAALLNRFIDKGVVPFARFCMSWRYATLAAFLALAIVTVGMFQSGTMRFIFFPQVEGDQVTITVTMPTGTPFSVTQSTMLKIENAVEEVRRETEVTDPVFQSVSISIGQTTSTLGPPGTAGTNSNAAHLGQLTIQLMPSDFRIVSSAQVEKMIRDRIINLPNIEKLEFQSSLIGGEADIDVELAHPEEKQLNEAAEELKQILSALEGTKEVADSFEPGKTEYVFELTDEGYAVGLTPFTLGQQLRSAFFGLEAERFQRGRSEVIVYVRYPKAERDNLASLQQTRIRLIDGTQVPLSSVAHIREQTGYSSIQTVNGRQVVNVTSKVDYELVTPSEVLAELNTTILPQLQERYTGLSYSFEGESRDQKDDLASLGRNMSIALLIIYVLLGAQLRSYAQPIVIMMAIPFGVIGAVWGHFLLGHDLTFISLFGIVALTGVVVNDSVVLMDYLNHKRHEGFTMYDSTVAAIKRRFRPILLTTLTTSLGLMPMLFESSMQAQFLIPMVISLATGILFSTFVILLLVPSMLMIKVDILRVFFKKEI